MYVNVDADEANGETDYNKYLASVEYKFQLNNSTFAHKT